MQLEDDVIAKPGYFSIMKTFAEQQSSSTWVLLEFSTLGFIGMFEMYRFSFKLQINFLKLQNQMIIDLISFFRQNVQIPRLADDGGVFLDVLPGQAH